LRRWWYDLNLKGQAGQDSDPAACLTTTNSLKPTKPMWWDSLKTRLGMRAEMSTCLILPPTHATSSAWATTVASPRASCISCTRETLRDRGYNTLSPPITCMSLGRGFLVGYARFGRHLPLPESNAHCHCRSTSLPFVSTHCQWVMTNINLRPGRVALSPVYALESFRKAAQPRNPAMLEEEITSIVSSERAARTRGSFDSVLEMMSTTLAVVPSRCQRHGPVPLRTPLSSISVS
jgi:hypothetical protein